MKIPATIQNIQGQFQVFLMDNPCHSRFSWWTARAIPGLLMDCPCHSRYSWWTTRAISGFPDRLPGPFQVFLINYPIHSRFSWWTNRAIPGFPDGLPCHLRFSWSTTRAIPGLPDGLHVQFQVFKDTYEPGVNKSLWYGHGMLVAFVCDPPRLQYTRLLSLQNTDNRSVKPKSSSADRHRPCLPALGFIDPLCLSGEREGRRGE